jgi:hypothetical protein
LGALRIAQTNLNKTRLTRSHKSGSEAVMRRWLSIACRPVQRLPSQPDEVRLGALLKLILRMYFQPSNRRSFRGWSNFWRMRIRKSALRRTWY